MQNKISSAIAGLRKPFPSIVLISIFALFFSFIGFLIPAARDIAFFVILAAVLVLALYKFEYGLYAALIELILGSKGYLFYFEWGGCKISIRIALFLIVLGVYLAKLILKKIEFAWDKRLVWFVPFFAAIVLGSVYGLFRRFGFQNVFFDANGYFYLLYLFPFLSAFVPRQVGELRRDESPFSTIEKAQRLKEVVIASGMVLAIFGLVLFYIFSHDWINADLIYKWLRDTVLFEITFTGSVFRVFAQSQIFLFPVLFLSLLDIFERRNLYLAIAGAFFAVSGVFVSLSRSFFVGLAAGAILFLAAVYLKNKKESTKIFFAFILICLASVGFLWTVEKNEPVAIAERFLPFIVITAEKLPDPASLTRKEELIPLFSEILKKPFLGWGFGKTATFTTRDPRALTMLPQCVGKEECPFTTYAFEWGYLDLWLKLGLFGLISLFGILYSLFKRGWGMIQSGDFSAVWLLSSLAAVAVINIFSPYLNHPLGLGALILFAVFLFISDTSAAP